jgi:hypothetical protein
MVERAIYRCGGRIRFRALRHVESTDGRCGSKCCRFESWLDGWLTGPAKNLTSSIVAIRRASMARREDVMQLLPWWAKLAHRAMAARVVDETEVSDAKQALEHAVRASGIRVRAAVDRDASA